ncbi:MAG: hypothetical protein IPK68_10835 [Bdellovibrionales bacterium]|nr:hypothetical protein [Bdellovibrionales bacterium]
MSIHLGKFFLFFLLGVSLAFCSAVSATNDAGSGTKSAKSACRNHLSNSDRSNVEHPQTLEDLFVALDARIGRSDPFFSLPKVSIDFIAFPRIPAVQAEQVIVGKGGGGYFLFRRIGQTWRRHGGPNFFAPESDPTWIISALGPRVAAFLGFRLIRSDQVELFGKLRS